ncbi:hypothetical protein ACHQM5_011217 [Ranunculus cassubicifolius]
MEVDVPELPEGCMTHIISFTSPEDACVSAIVSSAFRSAADSDLVWGKFLPTDYIDIISNSVSPLSLSDFSSKKELYFRLCNDPIFLDGGTKYFNLDKRSGKKCFTIGARGLGIAWGDTPQYWIWRSHSDSRFAEVAELRSVFWLKIWGTIDTRVLSLKTIYAAYLVIQLAENTYRLDHPVDVWINLVGEAGNVSETRSVYLKQPSARRAGIVVPSMRVDGWMEIEIGEFYNDQGDDGEVVMNLFHHDGSSRSGLIVQGIELRPKYKD